MKDVLSPALKLYFTANMYAGTAPNKNELYKQSSKLHSFVTSDLRSQAAATESESKGEIPSDVSYVTTENCALNYFYWSLTGHILSSS